MTQDADRREEAAAPEEAAAREAARAPKAEAVPDAETLGAAPAPSRRAFVIGGVALAAGVALGGAARPFAASADVLRPPGALPEEEFMARCNRCERCISVCPEDVLRPMGIEEGVVQVKTPTLDYRSDFCTFCDLCREVCPVAAIGPVDPYVPEDGRIGVAVVHEDLCLAFLEAGSCGICIDTCEDYEALSFDAARRPVVDAAKCNGCGECEKICPANILTSFGGGQVRGIQVVTGRAFREQEGGRQ